MAYLVLARKWRPTRFEDVVGQGHITQTLQNAIRRDRVPHALLFIGSRGVGKTSCARIFAKALNCLSSERATPDPCDQCESCLSISDGSAVDFFEIDGASNNSVEQVRELRESTRFSPTSARVKVYLIDEVHMLSIGAFNALLKVLEEPPPRVIFIFATTEPHKIPDTIISRCQRFDFRRIQEQAIVGALARICEAEGVKVERAALDHLAREAQGGMRDALSLLDQLISFCGEEIDEAAARRVLGLAPRAALGELVLAIAHRRPSDLIERLDEEARGGLDLRRLFHDLLAYLRDLILFKVCEAPERLIELPAGEVQAMHEIAAQLEVPQLHRFFQRLMSQGDAILRAAFPRLALEMTLLQLCEQGETAAISDVLEGLIRLEAKLGSDDDSGTNGAGGMSGAGGPGLSSGGSGGGVVAAPSASVSAPARAPLEQLHADRGRPAAHRSPSSQPTAKLGTETGGSAHRVERPVTSMREHHPEPLESAQSTHLITEGEASQGQRGRVDLEPAISLESAQLHESFRLPRPPQIEVDRAHEDRLVRYDRLLTALSQRGESFLAARLAERSLPLDDQDGALSLLIAPELEPLIREKRSLLEALIQERGEGEARLSCEPVHGDDPRLAMERLSQWRNRRALERERAEILRVCNAPELGTILKGLSPLGAQLERVLIPPSERK
ncbi:MAG: DNA polymerase III subunit gamma/tau [Myxococcota bacterium]|nr:DNA polymerase III subunit gamma/tau [Myxococcota bacterium]